MKVWQIVLIVIAGIALFVGMIVGGVFYATSGVTDTGDAFFEAAARGDYQAAHELTSAELRRTSDPDGLKTYLEANGLADVTDTSWSSRSMENNTGVLEGSVTTGSGGTIPLKLRLVKEKGGWKISFMEVERAGLSTVSGTDSGMGGVDRPGKLEPNGQMQALVMSDTRRFLAALHDDDFEEFLPSWYGGMTAAELEPLANAREDRADIGAIAVQLPVITSAEMGKDGEMKLQGYFENANGRYEFAHAYANDGGQPKLVDFSYDIKPRR